ncbi:MAG: MFS transporter [Lachnospiraceae bacterium]|nr:MFS transporter [Lachnospiraceae bacterium]
MFSILNSKEKKQQFFFTYGVFMINGMLALSIGSLLPYVKEARGLGYVFSGMLVSLHSVGNLLSSFIAGVLPVYLGRKKSILLFESLFAIAFALLLFGKSPAALVLAFLLTGLARGAASNFNNKTINQLAPGQAWMINGLHAMFAIGAFLFPLLLTAVTSVKTDNWVYACYFMLAMGVLAWILYYLIPVEENAGKKQVSKQSEQGKEKPKADYGFFKEPMFWLCTAILFFYLCAEQGVIGWLITYFKDSGFLSASLSQVMASVLWIMILAGRLSAAWLSTKMKKENLLVIMGIGFVAFFFVLLFGRSTGMIVLGIMGFGYSMAGIYPTTVSFTGQLIQKYQLSWSFILTIASFGSILMPSVIGKIAEQAGIVYGMSSIVVVILIDLCLLIALKVFMAKRLQ